MLCRLLIWAVAWDFQQCGILTCVDSDEPVQPPFKLSNSKWCSVNSLTIIEYSSNMQRLWSDCAYAQADLRLCWSHIPHCWKSHALAQIIQSLHAGKSCMLFLLSADLSFSKSTILKNSFRNTISVLNSLDPFCWAWSGSKLFVKVISRRYYEANCQKIHTAKWKFLPPPKFNSKNLYVGSFLCAFLLSVDFLKLTFSKKICQEYRHCYLVEPDLGLTVC